MKNWKILLPALLMVLAVASCGGDAASAGNAAENPNSVGTSDGNSGTAAGGMEAGGLKLTPFTGSPEFPGAKLGLINPPAGADLVAGNNRFEFSVTNFVLDEPTPQMEEYGIADNPEGQYVALILNNGPVIQMNEASHDQKLDDGHYVMLAVPSLSYHESEKTSGGHILRKFNVGQPENYKEIDLKAPHMFYHWPSGSVTGGKVLLDFYLVNCTLGPDNFKVKATINGTGFTLTNWASYIIEGLPMGENKIKLELLDATGASVSSPFNPVERTFTLEAGA
jgi:hypothetical protein